MYLEENNFERAALHFQAILRRTPDNSNRDIFGVAAYNFGQTLIRTGRPAEAQEYFRLAVQLHPEIQGAL